MYVFIAILFVILFPLSVGAADSAVLEFKDGRQVTVSSCRVVGDDIYYTLPGSKKEHRTNYDAVDSVSFGSGGEPSQVFVPEQSEPDNQVPASYIIPSEVMENLKTRLNLIFGNERIIRELAREDIKNNSQTGSAELLEKLYDRMGMSEEEQKAYQQEIDYLPAEQREVADKVFAGVSEYIDSVCQDERSKTGKPFRMRNIDKPNVIKSRLMGYMTDYLDTDTEEMKKKKIMAVFMSLKGFLSRGDVDGASGLFLETSRAEYASAFSSLKKANMLRKVADGMVELKIVSVGAGEAEGRINRLESGRTYSSVIRFVRMTDGWKIVSY